MLGAGLMGAQIGVEYLAGGHDVTFVARDVDGARRRVDEALALAGRIGLDVRGAASFASAADPTASFELIAESLPESMELKVELLRPLAEALPEATIASNTSSLSITSLGEAAGAPTRTLGVHYWNPPLLMPVVEVIPGEHTDSALVARTVETLTAVGKQPVVVERDVPGFVWNRLQAAVMREALWLVDNGVVSPGRLDAIVREGLARRWRHVGPFAAAALGGAGTWLRVGENLVPELSDAPDLASLERWLEGDPAVLEAIRERRDEGLLEDLG